MKANTIIGGIIIAILLASVIFAFASPIILGPLIRFEEEPKVTRTYSFTSDDAPGVDYINLNFTVKAGGIAVNFTDDSNLIYRFVFEQESGVVKPYIENVTAGNKLLVNVFAESGDVGVTFGNQFIYNGTLKLGVGGITAKLSKDANLEFFNLIVMYAGGVSVEIYDNASFDRLDIKANTGGIRLYVNSVNLERNSSISAEVEVGGIITDSLLLGSDLGCRLKGFADIGGIALNTVDFEKIKETFNEVEIRSNNYLTAPTRLEIEIFLGLGGAIISQQPSFTFPIGFG
ncbi:MAG: hypothetical protein ACUVTD_05165 [Nitrososphaerales archaeon]